MPRLRQEREAGRRSFVLHAGHVRRTGWRDWAGRLGRATFTQRLAAMLVPLLAAALAPAVLRWTGPAVALGQALVLAAISAWMLWRFHRRITAGLDAALQVAREIAGCNLAAAPAASDERHPLALLMEQLSQIQINLRAVVGDARLEENAGFGAIAVELAQGAQDLSSRTEAQAGSLEQTASAMEQLSATAQHAAAGARQVLAESAAPAWRSRAGAPWPRPAPWCRPWSSPRARWARSSPPSRASPSRPTSWP